MMFRNIFLAGLFIFGLGVGDVFATGDRVADKAIKKLDELAATPASGDWIPVSDVSADQEKKLDVDRLALTGAANTFTAAQTFSAKATFALGFVETALIVTPDDSDGAAVNMITAGVRNVDVGAVVNDTDDYIVLPAIAGVPVGFTITIGCNAGGAFEVRTPATSGELINSVDADGTQEWVAIDTNIVIVRKLSDADGWILLEYDTLGVVVAAHAPN